MIESKVVLTKSVGPWPTNATEDVVNARDELAQMGHSVLVVTPMMGYYVPVGVRVSSRLYETLNQHISGTDVSYREFLENNKIGVFVEDAGLEDDIALVSFENDTIQINGLEVRSSARKVIK